MYGFNKTNPVFVKNANFLFSFQTDQGDIRGILGNQYTPYYTAAILELLIKGGYVKDARVEKTFKWLVSIRQNDLKPVSTRRMFVLFATSVAFCSKLIF